MRTQISQSKRVFPEGLLGKKLGMTRVFSESGESIPVTVIQVGPCYVVAVKKVEKDGYSAVQFGFEPKKPQSLTKSQQGHFAKAGRGCFTHLQEMRCNVGELGWEDPGKEVTVSEVFKEGELVDVSGNTIGRGFAGVVKRFKVGGQPATRGTHEYRRHIGAIGCRKWPGRVHPGKRMPGHMGNEQVTVQNLQIVGVKPEDNLLLVRGGVPGAEGGLLVIRKAVKTYGTKGAKQTAK